MLLSKEKKPEFYKTRMVPTETSRRRPLPTLIRLEGECRGS